MIDSCYSPWFRCLEIKEVPQSITSFLPSGGNYFGGKVWLKIQFVFSGQPKLFISTENIYSLPGIGFGVSFCACCYHTIWKCWEKVRLAPVLKTIFQQCVISYTGNQSNSDGSV